MSDADNAAQSALAAAQSAQAAATSSAQAAQSAANGSAAPIANATSADAGALTGTEVIPLSRGAGLLQTLLSSVAAFVKAPFAVSNDRTKGAALIGYNPTGTGAAPTTVQSFLDSLLQYASAQFYQGAGAKINRLRDRLFVGAAADNAGTNVANQPDWLTQYQLAKGRTYGYVQTSTLSVLNDKPVQGSLTTAVFGAQSKNGMVQGSQVIAVTGIGVNNENTGNPANAAWGGYFEAYRDTSVDGNGGAYGVEIDAINLVSAKDSDPYSQNPDQTIALQIASGGEFATFDATAALNFQNNGSKFLKGIIVGSNAITSGEVVALASGYKIAQWYSATGVKTGYIAGYGTTAAASLSLQLLDNQIQAVTNAGKLAVQLYAPNAAVNYASLRGAIAGQPVQMLAGGDDLNVSIQYVAKGTGQHLFSGPIVPDAVGGIAGVSTNSDAAAGSVGEYGSVSATGVALITGAATNVVSVPLGAGDYEVWGAITFVPAAGTSPTLLQCGANTVSATLGGVGTQSFLNLAFPAGQPQGLAVPRQRVKLAAAGNAYLVGVAIFTGGTLTANAALSWRRVR